MGVVDADPTACPARRRLSARRSSPATTTRPRSTIATGSQIFSTSSSRCDESRTVRPSATKPRIIGPELVDAGRVEAVRRLVEDQQLGVAEQRAGDAEPLAHARASSVLTRSSARSASRRGRARRRSGRAPPRSRAAATIAEVLAAGEVAVEARLLDDRADARERWRRSSGHAAGRAAASMPGVGAGEPEQHPDQRRLAGAVRAEVAEGGAARNMKVDGVDRHGGAEALGQADGLDRELGWAGRAHGFRVRARRWLDGAANRTSRRRWARLFKPDSRSPPFHETFTIPRPIGPRTVTRLEA